MPQARLQDLFDRYVHQAVLTPAEEEELTALLADPSHKAFVQQMIDRLSAEAVEETAMQPAAANAILEAILQADRAPAPVTAPVRSLKRVYFRRFAAAAAILILLAAGVYWLRSGDKNTAQPALAFTVPTHIQPGSDKALLTLGDGRQVVLDTAQNGVLQSLGAVAIRKTKDGELVYDLSATASLKGMANEYNTIATPNGGQYQVLLPDGSKVWLNAASSIRFPVVFTGRERKVQVTGEAYFEIAAKAHMPFMVEANATTVQVLGTRFNINSYTDEHYQKTTLLEGSVQVKAGNSQVLLQPGQQAMVKSGIAEVVNGADLQEAIAWKDGLFYMSEMQIPAIMRQISRWYNVEVVYPSGRPVGTISGKIPRNMRFSNVLQVLQKSGVSLTMEGDKIVVNP